MAKFPLSFGTEHRPGYYGADTGAHHVNCRVRPLTEGKADAIYQVCDGFRDFATLTGGGKFRGHLVANGYLYVVSGRLLFQVDAGGSAVVVGGIPSDGPVYMDVNSLGEITVAAEGLKYLVTGSIMTEITSANIGPALSVTTINDRSVYCEANATIRYSEVSDPTNVSGISFFTAESEPDGAHCALEHKGELYVFGHSTIDIYRDVGATIDAFRPVSGSPLEKGCASGASVSRLSDLICFVADDNHVYMILGYNLKPIANENVVKDIAATADKTTIHGQALYWRGEPFYRISADGWTWECNLKHGKWFKRKSYGIERWRGEGGIDFNGRHIIGDYALGKLYEVVEDYQTEAGAHLVMTLRSPPQHAFPEQVVCDRIDLDFAAGYGLNAPSDSHSNNPTVVLRYSDDGGFSWSYDIHLSLGVQGDRRATCSETQLGTTGQQGRIWEVQASSPTIRSFLGATVYGRLAAAR